MTYASRLPSDHPGLRLDRPQARSLRRGPIVVVAAVLCVAVLFALLSPSRRKLTRPTRRPAQGRASSQRTSQSPKRSRTLRPTTPKSRPRRRSSARRSTVATRRARRQTDHPAPAPGGGFGRSSFRQTMREERDKAFGVLDPRRPRRLLGRARRRRRRRLPAPSSATPAAAIGKTEAPAWRRCSGARARATRTCSSTRRTFSPAMASTPATYLNQPVLLPRSPYRGQGRHDHPGVAPHCHQQRSAGPDHRPGPGERLRHRHWQLPPDPPGLEAPGHLRLGCQLRPGAGSRLLESACPTGRRLHLSRVHARRRPRRSFRGDRRGRPPLVADHHRRRARHAALRHGRPRGQATSPATSPPWRRAGPPTPAAPSTGGPADHPEEPRHPADHHHPAPATR